MTESPCIRVCTLDKDDVCLGCFRAIDEITSWSEMTEEKKRFVVDSLEERRKRKIRSLF